jgi:hypothetical protein
MFVAARFIFTALALFTASMVAFTILHPESIRVNVRLYAVLTALYFTADASQALAATAAGSVLGANVVVIPLYAALGVAWIWFMRAAGESVERRPAPVSRHRIDEFNRQLLDGVRELRP